MPALHKRATALDLTRLLLMRFILILLSHWLIIILCLLHLECLWYGRNVDHRIKTLILVKDKAGTTYITYRYGIKHFRWKLVKCQCPPDSWRGELALIEMLCFSRALKHKFLCYLRLLTSKNIMLYSRDLLYQHANVYIAAFINWLQIVFIIWWVGIYLNYLKIVVIIHSGVKATIRLWFNVCCCTTWFTDTFNQHFTSKTLLVKVENITFFQGFWLIRFSCLRIYLIKYICQWSAIRVGERSNITKSGWVRCFFIAKLLLLGCIHYVAWLFFSSL